MRVFSAVRHSNDPRFYYGGLWSGNFHPALGRLGHDVVESTVDLLPASRFMHIAGDFTPEERAVRAAITTRIVDEVRKAHRRHGLDVFLGYFYNAHFDPEGFDEIHRLGIPTLNYYCNSVYQFDWVAEIAAKVNYSWHPERAAGPRYRSVGATPVWVQMAADPEVYKPVSDKRRQAKACFIGQRYADRDRWLGSLVRAGVPVEIYGPGWGMDTPAQSPNGCETAYLGRRQPAAGNAGSYLQAVRDNLNAGGVVGGLRRTWLQARYRRETRRLAPLFKPYARGPIPFDRIPDVVAGYEVVVNTSNVWADGRPGAALIPHVRLRDFEVPMSRACYLTGHTDEIAEFYEPGKEIDTYVTPEEFVDKTRFYLQNPADAERLRVAGFLRARRDHTWERRFSQLFSAIGLSRPDRRAV